MRKEETKEEDEVYTPYEHLRTVIEDSEFYALEYMVDVDRDILGQTITCLIKKTIQLLCNRSDIRG